MGNFPGSTSEPGPSYRERRSVPRYSLIASAEISEPTSELRIAGRISEISRKGCYVDLLNTLPVSTPIILRITRDSGTFSTTAKIIYVQEAMGMGVAFLDTTEEQLQILDSWLAEIAAA
jgi:PilZ domain